MGGEGTEAEREEGGESGNSSLKELGGLRLLDYEIAVLVTCSPHRAYLIPFLKHQHISSYDPRFWPN